MSSLHNCKSTVASQHLITPRNTGHPQGIISARTCHLKPVGQRCLWNATANQHQENAVPGWTVTKLTTQLSQALLPGHPSPKLPSHRPCLQKQEHHQLCLLVSECKLGDQHLKKLLSTENPIHFSFTFSYHFKFKQHSSPKSLPPCLVLNCTSALPHNAVIQAC